jgi:hypothetical protein
MNLIEYLRRQVVGDLFKTASFSKAWNQSWKTEVNNLLTSVNARDLIDLGDNLSDIFLSTRGGQNVNRGQDTVGIAGASWECLITWYLNICTVGTRVLAVKKTSQLPVPLKSSIQVNYSNSQTHSESDIVVIVFPDDPVFTNDIVNNNFGQMNGVQIEPFIGTRIVRSRIPSILDILTSNHFNDFGLGVVQCKTNWNENAQVPMLWDMIYQTNGFKSNNISIGANNFNMQNLTNFTYSFVTVPSGKGNIKNYKATHLPVLRVRNLTGGNYWGFPTANNVAFSMKEIFNRNFTSGFNQNPLTDLTQNIGFVTNGNIFNL